MKKFTTNIVKSKIDNKLNDISVMVSELNTEVKNILLNIVTFFTAPQLQVAWAWTGDAVNAKSNLRHIITTNNY